MSTTNPFEGYDPRGPVKTSASFPADRLRSAGADEDALARLRVSFDDAKPAQRDRFAARVLQGTNDDVLELIGEYRRDSYDTEHRVIDDVLADVDADPALARHALESERGRGARARKTLVDRLETLVEEQQLEDATDQGDEPADDAPDGEGDDTPEETP